MNGAYVAASFRAQISTALTKENTRPSLKCQSSRLGPFLNLKVRSITIGALDPKFLGHGP